jgi:hypothetical protein
MFIIFFLRLLEEIWEAQKVGRLGIIRVYIYISNIKRDDSDFRLSLYVARGTLSYSGLSYVN